MRPAADLGFLSVGPTRTSINRPSCSISPSRTASRVNHALSQYRDSLTHDRRVLFDRYRVQDFALKVVGVGSVGTRCYVALLMSADDQPLILQFKEARHSVLEPYLERSRYDHQGERVVRGQRLLQGSSDIFLG
jgi:uncharacterized protein (DUF2252 family)